MKVIGKIIFSPNFHSNLDRFLFFYFLLSAKTWEQNVIAIDYSALLHYYNGKSASNCKNHVLMKNFHIPTTFPLVIQHQINNFFGYN